MILHTVLCKHDTESCTNTSKAQGEQMVTQMQAIYLRHGVPLINSH